MQQQLCPNANKTEFLTRLFHFTAILSPENAIFRLPIAILFMYCAILCEGTRPFEKEASSLAEATPKSLPPNIFPNWQSS